MVEKWFGSTHPARPCVWRCWTGLAAKLPLGRSGNDRQAGQRAVGLAELGGRERGDAKPDALERLVCARETGRDQHAIAKCEHVGGVDLGCRNRDDREVAEYVVWNRTVGERDPIVAERR